MDTYENDQLTPEPEAQEPSQPIEQEIEATPEEDGFYHGAGVGVTETTETPPASDTPREEQPTPQAEEKPKKVKKHRFRRAMKKIGIGVGIAVAVLALVAAGCGITYGITTVYWREQSNLLMQNFEERVALIQQELESYVKQNQNNTYVAVTEEGLTPSQIYNNNIGALVAVNCVSKYTVDDKSYETASAGSGFVLTENGYIVTNQHVVSDADTIYVSFYNGTTLPATLVGSDSICDIAVLKVEAIGLQTVTIGKSSDLHVGDQVVAIGNALGELSFSLSVGYVSGMDRDVTTEGTELNMIQTDVAINSGNSGGPLFNSKGEVVGITTAKYSGTTSTGASIEGISFAIPTDDVLEMIYDLINYGYIRTAYLGVAVSELPWSSAYSSKYGIPMGVYVESVVEGGCAYMAGIQAGDIITNVGGYEVESLNDLTKILRQFRAGDRATIVVYRRATVITLNIVFLEKTQY